MNLQKIKIIQLILLVFIASIICGQDEQSEERFVYLVSPRGTEIFSVGEEIKIEYISKNVSRINIDLLSRDGQILNIATNLNADKKYFILTLDEKFSSEFKVQISDFENNEIKDSSPSFLTVRSLSKSNKSSTPKMSNATSNAVTIKLMPLGNSITEGYIPSITNREGYRKPLKEKLNDYGLEIDFVGSEIDGLFDDNQHEGHGGWHAKHWFGNKNYSIADHLTDFLINNPPDIILLHIGTNDIGEYDYSGPINDNTIDTTVSDVSGLLDTIYSFDPNIKVILAQITNRLDKISTPTLNEYDTTAAFNNALGIMANDRILNGDNLSLVDMESALDYPIDLSDSTHPNVTGYEKMADVWFDAIIEALPKYALKVFLEGPYTTSSNMVNNLTLPITQPFNKAPWNYGGTENVNIIPNNVVDWVLVTLKDNISGNSLYSRAGFIKNTGEIVDLDGNNGLAFPIIKNEYYIEIQHRNHLKVLSSEKVQF